MWYRAFEWAVNITLLEHLLVLNQAHTNSWLHATTKIYKGEKRSCRIGVRKVQSSLGYQGIQTKTISVDLIWELEVNSQECSTLQSENPQGSVLSVFSSYYKPRGELISKNAYIEDNISYTFLYLQLIKIYI